jgi:hypothetical protein
MLSQLTALHPPNVPRRHIPRPLCPGHSPTGGSPTPAAIFAVFHSTLCLRRANCAPSHPGSASEMPGRFRKIRRSWGNLRNASRFWTVFFAVCLLSFPVVAQAQFSYITNYGAIDITGYTGRGGMVSIPSTINGLPVKFIGYAAFRFSNLSGVSIPTSVTDIASSAFYGCTNLASVTLPGNITSLSRAVFYGCSSLTNAVFSEGVLNIPDAAFGNCVSLERIDLPSTVTNIGEAAFSTCSRLQAIKIPGRVSSVGPYAFYYCTSLNSASISNGVQVLGAHAFEGCVSLLSLSIPATVGTIGTGLMADCDGLEAISVDPLNGKFQTVDGILLDKPGKTLLQYPPGRGGTYSIPNSVARVGDFAFFGCGRLEGITTPTSVTAIGESAFDGCSALTNLFIPASVTSIGPLAFRNCISVSAINVDSLNPAYSSVEGILFDKNQTTLIQYPPAKSGNYTVPNNVVTIGSWAFSHCTGLTNLTMGYLLANVGDAAFWGCTNLRTVYFLGNAPKITSDLFADGNQTLVYHVPTTTGWSDTLAGRAVSLWSPLLQTTARQSAMQTNGFEFTFSGPAGLTVVIEASPNLGTSAWFPIGTNILTGELASFTDRAATNLPYRFYRARWPLPPEYLFSFIVTNGAVTITKYLGTNAVVNVPDSIFGLPVVSIATYAFSYANGVQAVTIPNGVTNIGYGAFQACYDLTNVVMPNTVVTLGDYAFIGCENLKAMVLSSNLTSIGYSGFYGCAALREIIIPNSVISLGQYAFGECLDLASVTFPTNLAAIPLGTFANCHSLTSISLPDTVTNIGTSAFNGCRSLSALSLPSNVKTIDFSGFDRCTSLTNVEISSRTLGLGGLAFGDCTSLSSIHFGAALTNLVITTGTLMGSTNLSSITVDPLNSSYSAVDGVLFDKSAATLVLCPAGWNGFYVVPEGVTNIASGAFGACSALTRVVISDGVLAIGDRAFTDCTGLTSIILGRNIATIGNGAFSFCSALKEIYFRGNAPPSPSPNFSLYNAVVYYLPGTTGWSTTFAGLPTVLWNPQIATGIPNFGFGTNGFGFTVTGPSNLLFVVEACTNLAQPSWFAVSTNTLTGGSAHFSDPSSRDSAARFYRLRSP